MKPQVSVNTVAREVAQSGVSWVVGRVSLWDHGDLRTWLLSQNTPRKYECWEVETGGSLRLTGQPGQPTSQLPGQWEIHLLKQGAGRRDRNGDLQTILSKRTIKQKTHRKDATNPSVQESKLEGWGRRHGGESMVSGRSQSESCHASELRLLPESFGSCEQRSDMIWFMSLKWHLDH